MPPDGTARPESGTDGRGRPPCRQRLSQGTAGVRDGRVRMSHSLRLRGAKAGYREDVGGALPLQTKRPCEDPVAGLQEGEPVQRKGPGAGSRIRSARCGAHVHTVQRMRNASCEYGHGSSSFRLGFHLGLTAIVHQGRRKRRTSGFLILSFVPLTFGDAGLRKR